MVRPRNPKTTVGNLMIDISAYYSKLGTPDNQGCVPWLGPWHRQGYGMLGGYRITDDVRVMTVAHRITAMIKYNRTLTHDEFVIHTCSNVWCQEPTHLIIGDYVKKSAIMNQNGRGRYPGRRGPRKSMVKPQANRKYKYTEEEIRWCRTASSEEIAERFNITKTRASTFRYEMRRRYRWVI